MRAGTASQHERLLRLSRRNYDRAVDAGLSGVRVGSLGDGSQVEIEGRARANFGNCCYLGLVNDPRLKEAAKAAIDRFGPLYAASQAYSSVDLYTELEDLIGQMTEAPGLVMAATTTLGHLSCLPIVVSDRDLVILDSQSHASLQLTMQVLSSRQVPVVVVSHNDAGRLESVLAEQADRHRRVWYVADGVYSMFGDLAPTGLISDLMGRYENLHVYLDDAHGFSWTGLRGRGFVLSRLPWDRRLIVAAGLGKSFGSTGAALMFGDPEEAVAVRRLGGPMMFGGPIPPASLGAAVASARIHLSPEIEKLQSRIEEQIDLVATKLAEHRLPVASWAPTPLWFVPVGDVPRVLDIGRRMLDDGFYLNVSAFPAVPHGMGGLRFTNTLANPAEQVVDMIDRLAQHYREVVGESDLVVDLTEVENDAEPGTPSPISEGGRSRD